MGDFTVQISANLVKQLVEDGDKVKKRTKKPKSKISPESQLPQPRENKKQILDDSKTHRGTVASGWPIQPPLFVPVKPAAESAELEAIRSVLQESEKVLEKLNTKEENMVQEVTERAKILHEQEFKLPNQKPLPCSAEKDVCEACYKDHIGDPLRCRHLLRNYADCSRKARQQMDSTDK